MHICVIKTIVTVLLHYLLYYFWFYIINNKQIAMLMMPVHETLMPSHVYFEI